MRSRRASHRGARPLNCGVIRHSARLRCAESSDEERFVGGSVAGSVVVVAYLSVPLPSRRAPSTTREASEPKAHELTRLKPAVRVDKEENRTAAPRAGGIGALTATRVQSNPVEPIRLTLIPAGVPLDALARPQAMPGFGGFDLPPAFPETVARLNSKSVDPNWDSETEALTLGEVSSLIDQAVVSIHTECRATLCALLIVHSRQDVHFELPTWEALSDRLNVQRPLVHTGFAQDGTRFTAIYFGRSN
jgi:hypothetical protein